MKIIFKINEKNNKKKKFCKLLDKILYDNDLLCKLIFSKNKKKPTINIVCQNFKNINK
jgi:hypothetical protein